MELTAQQRHKRSKGTIAELFDEDWHQHVPPACRRRAATLGLISCRGFVQGGIFKTGEKIYREVRKEKGWVEELVSTGQDFTLCLYLPGWVLVKLGDKKRNYRDYQVQNHRGLSDLTMASSLNFGGKHATQDSLWEVQEAMTFHLCLWFL